MFLLEPPFIGDFPPCHVSLSAGIPGYPHIGWLRSHQVTIQRVMFHSYVSFTKVQSLIGHEELEVGTVVPRQSRHSRRKQPGDVSPSATGGDVYLLSLE